MAKILLVDDDEDMRESLVEALKQRGFPTVAVATGAEATELVRQQEFDCVVTDVQLAAMSGMELCERLRDIRPDIPVIVITGHGNMDVVVAAIRVGAYDFITKPVSVDALALALSRAVRHHQLTSEVTRLRQVLADGPCVTSIAGESQGIRRVLELIEQVAGSDASVLVTGESGTGKELVARAIHERSHRSKGPFVAVNCAAMPATLLESELFGHVRGAFTDAKRGRLGLFQQASGGTLFLDEIGDMPLEMQVKLLRVLQERRVRPVGGEEEVPFDVRLVTATNRMLGTQVEEGRFRADLYYRINVVHIDVPPLRDRQGDILLLAQELLMRHAQRTGRAVIGISASAAQKLVDYEWPGNVRELENCMERAVALTNISEITVEGLPEAIRTHNSTRIVLVGGGPDEMPPLEEIISRYIQRAMAACNGNKSQAAKVLGMNRRSLYRRLEDANASSAKGSAALN